MPAPKKSVTDTPVNVSDESVADTFAHWLPKFKPVPMAQDDTGWIIRRDLIDLMTQFPEFDFNGEGNLQVDHVNGNSSIVISGFVRTDGTIAYDSTFIKYNPSKEWQSPDFETPLEAFDALVQKLNAPKSDETPKRGPGRPRKATS